MNILPDRKKLLDPGFQLEMPRQWETALEAVNDGVCLLGPDGTLKRCNPAAAKILHRSHEDLIGRRGDIVLAQAFGRIHPERVAYLDDTPRPQTTDVEREGRWFRLTIVPVLDDQGDLSGSVLTIADITEHRRLVDQERVWRLRVSEAEELRDHADRLSSLEQLKSQFLRLASHELRGPVGVLAGYLSMLQDGSLGELPEPARAAMPTMLAKLAEMNLLIDQLLDTARLEDSRLALKLERLDVREVVEEAIQLTAPQVSSQHKVVTTLPDSEIAVMGDRVRLRIILCNLLDNALKYSPDGGEVVCSAGTWDSHVTLTVKDHGLGLDPDQMDVLFSRFGRLVTRENESIVGSGLGLYLSRELARMHGGDLTAESQYGEGSVFTLRVPLAPGNASVAAG